MLAALGLSTMLAPSSVANTTLAAQSHVLTDSHARFLTQSTFGPDAATLERVNALGPASWLDEQLAMPLGRTHVATFLAQEVPAKGKQQFFHSFWAQALTAPDQLRQRVAYALSQIFVVSAADACGANHRLGINAYHDMLLERAFGTYRDLLEAVTLHPVMGCYLSHLRNQKADPKTGRVPDENYAREVMQLFSLGLIELKPDGSPRLDAQGATIETYGPADVAGLAKVFTGWSWACPNHPADHCFLYRGTKRQTNGEEPWALPMVAYPQFHATEEKRFLGVTIPPQKKPDPKASLKVALDTLAAHPNVGPFIGKQLIVRLVKSNPSPAYVERVALAFVKNNGALGPTVKAILLDPEARSPSAMGGADAGKVREPVLALSALLRAMQARSITGRFTIGDTQQPSALNQAPYMAPSVFNFYRPGFQAAGSHTAARGLSAPELQIADESSLAGYANFMRNVIWSGLGDHVKPSGTETAPHTDVQLSHHTEGWTPLLKAALNPASLVKQLNELLCMGQMAPQTQQDIVETLHATQVQGKPDPETLTPASHRLALKRLRTGLLLTVTSPDYLVQR